MQLTASQLLHYIDKGLLACTLGAQFICLISIIPLFSYRPLLEVIDFMFDTCIRSEVRMAFCSMLV